MTCYTYDSTNHRCTNTNQNTVFTGAKELESFTILGDGKYKITVKGEAGWTFSNVGGYCNGSGGYNCPTYSAAGGTNIVEKVLTKNTVLKFIAIAGGSGYYGVGGSGVGLFFDGSLFMVAGGGAHQGGGGFLGGSSGGDIETSGYSWDGSRTNFNTTYASGANGGAGSGSRAGCSGFIYGGSGYCADNTCVSTYGTANNTGIYRSSPNNVPCFSTNSNGLPRGPGYANVVYCGPDASSTCP